MGNERVAWLRRFAISFAVGYLFIRLLGPRWSSLYSFEFPDSSSYRRVAALSPISPSFWFAERPPTYPLLLWTVGNSPAAVVVVQTALSFAAWIWLIRVIAATIDQRWVRYPAIIALLAVALQARWVFWNTLVLTESLSATLAVASLAAWIAWWRDPTRRRTYVVASLIVAWMLLRDSNAITWLVVAAPASIVAATMARRLPSPRRWGAALILGLSVLAGIYSIVAQVQTDRGATSFDNNVGLRWLPDQEMTEFMVNRGMPIDQALADRTGKSAWDDGEAFLVAPNLANYREWADSRGRSAAAMSFVLKAPWYIDRYEAESTIYGDPSYLLDYDHYRASSRFPTDPLGPLDPVRSFGTTSLWAIVSAAGIAVIFGAKRSLGMILGLLWLSVVVDTYLVFCADAIEVGRHLGGPWLRFSVLSIVIVAIATDTWWSQRERQRADTKTTQDKATDELETGVAP